MSKMIISGSTGEILSNIKRLKSVRKVLDGRTLVEKRPLCDILSVLVKKSGKTRAEIIALADIDRVYGYEIIRGKRMPGRDVLIKLLIVMDLDINSVQSVLKVSGYPALYPRNVRDAVIMHGITNKKGLIYINNTLYELNERML